jgi:uncharacterized protein (TIGR03000 family)
MNRSPHANAHAALVLAALVLVGGPARAQVRNPNPGTAPGPDYPYWGTAPSSYRGESLGRQGIGVGTYTPSPPPFSPGSGLGLPDLGLSGLAGSSYSPRPGQFSSRLAYSASRVGYYSPAALAEAASLSLTAPPPNSDNTAHVSLRVPAGAEVWFDGGRTRQTGTVRDYVSPPLPAGRTYVYEVRVRWQKDGKPVEQTRRVRVSANARVSLDLTTAAAPSSAQTTR